MQFACVAKRHLARGKTTRAALRACVELLFEFAGFASCTCLLRFVEIFSSFFFGSRFLRFFANFALIGYDQRCLRVLAQNSAISVRYTFKMGKIFADAATIFAKMTLFAIMKHHAMEKRL